MPASFIAVAFVAAVLIVNWRLLLLIAVACLVAMLAFGVGAFVPEQAGAPTSGVIQVAPAAPAAGDVGQAHTH